MLFWIEAAALCLLFHLLLGLVLSKKQSALTICFYDWENQPIGDIVFKKK